MYLVLDIGGTHARMALISRSYQETPFYPEVARISEIKICNDYQKDLLNLEKLFKQFKKDFTEEGFEFQIIAGAVAIAGVLSEDGKSLTNSPHLNSWENKDLEQDFLRIFGCRFIFRNDTYMAVYSVLMINNPKDDFWYVNWGTGIGGALVIKDANIKHSFPFHFQASEFGHGALTMDGISCECGQRGCWDAYCGGGQLEKQMGKNLAELSFAEWKPIFDNMAQGIINLYLSYPTKVIVLNGGVIQHQSEKLELLQELLNKKIKIINKRPQLLILRDGDNAGLIGSWIVASGGVS